MSRSETADSVSYFDDIAGSYTAWTASNAKFRERSRCFSALIQRCRAVAPTDLALDLGCGNGELTLVTSCAGFRVVGIDGSKEMLKRARTTVSPSTRGVSFREEHLPLRSKIVDEFRGTAGLIVASSVVEYLDNEVLFFSQCYEMLAPGGRALVSFANAASPRRRAERMFGARGPFRGTIVEVQRRQHGIEQILSLARGSGLDVENIAYFGSSFSAFARRAIGRKGDWLAPLMLVSFYRREGAVGAHPRGLSLGP
jgi:SAM-dependent methyltransferase